jgi:hypothetical protein
VIVGCGMTVGIAVIVVASQLRPEFEAWVRQDLCARLKLVIAVLTLITVGPVLGLAGYCWHLGQRILRAAQYPPPGLRVVRDTPIVTGDAARRRGRLVQWFAAVLGMAALLLAFFLWRLAYILPSTGAT